MAYNKKSKFSIDSTTFPDPFVSDEEKATEEYGKKFGNAIQYEWFHRQGGESVTNYQNKKAEYHELRLYGRGEQSSQLYKDLITGGDSSSYTNYDWRPLQVAPKFIDIIRNQMLERLFEVRIEATDKVSIGKKDHYKKYLEDLMRAKPLMMEAQEVLGVDVSPEGGIEGIMDTQEEIDLHMKLDFKPALEIAAEMAIDATLRMNDYEEIQEEFIRDIVEIGIGAIKHVTDPNKGIVPKYVDPANLVYSYPKKKNFSNVHYYGEVETITIMEFKRLTGDRFSKDDLLDIAGSTRDWNNYQGNESYQGNLDASALDSLRVQVLHFTFKTVNSLTYKKKYKNNGGYSMTKRESTFKKKDKNYKGYDVVKKDIDVWYKGSMVLGTNVIYNYGKCENMIREKGNINVAPAPYIVYAPEIYQNRTRSMLKRIISYLDIMQQTHIKIQQTVAKARPNGVAYDIAGMSEVDMGGGSSLSPLELMKIYDETGNVLYSSIRADGTPNPAGIPIQELANSVTKNLSEFIATYNFYLNLIRDALGIPQGADASLPHPDTLVGVQEQVNINSNTATRHILEGILNMTERLVEGISLRLVDIFKYPHLKDLYINHIGEVNVKVLEALKDYSLQDLGTHVELKPSQQEKQLLESNIQIALSKDLITIDDAIDIRMIGNMKLANQQLKLKREKREKARQAHEKEIAAIQQEAQIKAAQAASQLKQQEYQMKLQADLALEDKKIQNEIMKLRAEEESRLRLMEREYQYNLGIKSAETQVTNQKEKYKEDRKDMRQDRQNTQASKLIEQRDTKGASLNFESESDRISGNIGTDDFIPR